MTPKARREGARLRRAREALGMSLQDVGDILGCTKQAVHSYEALGLDSVSTLERLAVAFGTTLGVVLDIKAGRLPPDAVVKKQKKEVTK